MLTPEEAQERLESQRIDDWNARRAERIAKLGKASAAAVLVLGEETYGYRVRREDCGPALEALSDRQRTALFDAFLPGLGVHVQRMWEAGVARPYQTGWDRRAFRAPNDPPVTLGARRDAFLNVVDALEGHHADPAWVARWAPYLSGHDSLSPLLATVIDGGGSAGEQVFEALVASAEGTDEIGAMGRHVATSLLIAARPDGWELVERLLLAAQREEGLRQAILEAVDVAHPDAFRRMLAVIIEHGLTRFSATVRAADVWLGLGENAGDRRRLDAMLERLLGFLDDEGARAAAIERGEAEDAYLALWSAALRDAPATVALAEPLLRDDAVERRWVAAYLLRQLGLESSAAALAQALDDPDLRVARIALYGVDSAPDLFERLERLLGRLDRARVELDPIVWPWTGRRIERADVASRLRHSLGDRPPGRLLLHLKAMDPYARASAATVLAGEPHPDIRTALLALVGDPSAEVRRAALEAAAKLDVSEEETVELEALLTRKAGDLRRGVIGLLLARKDEQVLASADRLVGAGKEQQRLAGLELLRGLFADGRATEKARARAEAYRRERPQRTEAEDAQLAAVLGAEPEAANVTRDDGLGLRDLVAETPAAAPADRGVELATAAAATVLEQLDALVHEHRDQEIAAYVLLGDASWDFPRAVGFDGDAPMLAAVELPLRDLWERWLSARPDAARDDDGCELLRAAVLPSSSVDGYTLSSPQTPGGRALLGGLDPPDNNYGVVVGFVAEWLAYLHPPENAAGFLLDAAETLLARMSGRDFVDAEPPARWSWRDQGWLYYMELARSFALLRPQLWGTADYRRLWALERWVERPDRPGGRLRLRRPEPLRSIAPPVESLLVAYRAGAATDADVVAHLLGPGDVGGRSRALSQVSGRRPHPLVAADKRFARVLDRIRRRVVDVELGRGDLPSPATSAALALKYSGGLDVLARTLKALGREKLVRGWTYDDEARVTVFSRIVRATHPGPGDRPERFAATVKLPDARLVELAAYAPQWARHVEAAVGWPGLADAIWWMHAHTKDDSWTVEQEIREAWAAEVAERTPLSADELLDGAVDVAWFERVYAALGEQRWPALDKAAKYCSTGGGHKRAQLFADAIRGAVDEGELRKRIADKRHKDSARALGLLPGGDRDEVVLDRYRLLQEFIRTSRKFGSQRQASERRAAEIGLDNLARTAGYRDPIRLGWAMEARGVADLAEGHVEVEAGGVAVRLVIDDEGRPEVSVRRGEKALKAVPAAARKSPEVKALRARATELRRQASRMRGALEQAMVRGDAFSGDELHELAAHPLLAPRLSRLIVIGEDAAGYPAADGRVLRDHAGERHAIGRAEAVRIAHPVDLLAGGEWESWQRDCLGRRVVQPFKQVFRELYVPTQAEFDDGDLSRRYAGHQLQPRTALALLGGRGWVAHPEEGVRRTFHDAGLTVTLGFLDGWGSPVEVEAPTLEEVRFHPRGEWRPVAIADVPPRLFSEVMRDLDLVVSVAHVGGVDPEVTASTVEMRAALVEETCELLSIENVRVENRWALVDGRLGEYSIHLGSAVVHRRPGGSVCIVPVHGQHRGRVFLPFADDDPKTAEVMAKVLLLARDHEIRDPTILEQIRG
jgi:Family of unknown function (DUF5724)/Domain of unknown function (DUF4132)/HEAT repeats